MMVEIQCLCAHVCVLPFQVRADGLYSLDILGFRLRVNNVTRRLQHYILHFKKCTCRRAATLSLSLSFSPMCVYVSVGTRVCARAPWWQPLDRSKAAMMNRHLALGSALAQWAVNLPLPLSARRMLNKVIWIFVILMWLHVKAHRSLTVRENMRRFILPCWPIGWLWWGIPANTRLNESESWIVY